MEKKEIYVVVAILLVILGFALFAGGGEDVADLNTDETTNNEGVTDSNASGGAKSSGMKPTPIPTPLVPTPAPGVSQPVPTIPSPASLNGSTFTLLTYNGTPVSPSYKFTISFNSGSLSAKFCNNMSSTYSLDGSYLKTSNLVGTLMYCASPSNVMQMESDLASMLGSGATIYQSGKTLIVSHSNGTVFVFDGF